MFGSDSKFRRKIVLLQSLVNEPRNDLQGRRWFFVFHDVNTFNLNCHSLCAAGTDKGRLIWFFSTSNFFSRFQTNYQRHSEPFVSYDEVAAVVIFFDLLATFFTVVFARINYNNDAVSSCNYYKQHKVHLQKVACNQSVNRQFKAANTSLPRAWRISAIDAITPNLPVIAASASSGDSPHHAMDFCISPGARYLSTKKKS